MKTLSILLLLTSIFVATFSEGLMVASFNLNQNFIAKNLCINRNNPNSKCEGHCYLTKQLNKQEKSSSTNTSAKNKIQIQLFFGAKRKTTNYSNKTFFCYNIFSENLFSQQYPQLIFHPPAA